MSPTSYQTALPRVSLLSIALDFGIVQLIFEINSDNQSDRI
ncbi:hypothetical protein [Leptolyngbya sp. Cla-17]|nr:hypothetical protein [Leptolyngbya sp. Cla-17]